MYRFLLILIVGIIQQSSAYEDLAETVKPDNTLDPVQSSIGSLGRWQILIVFAIFLVKFPIAWHQLSIVFLAPPVDFECYLPDNLTDQCSTDCTEHVFDRSVFTNTIITEWDLVCDRAQFANISQTMVMVGILVGSFLFGYLADIFGRRTPLVAAAVLQFASGTGAALVTDFWIFSILRFLCALATGGTMVTSFVLVMEIVGKEWRSTIGILYHIPFQLGHLLLAVFGYYLRDWRAYQLAISLPSIILVSYYWILPESPRWLMATGKPEEAIKILKKGAEFNKLPTDNIRNNVITAKTTDSVQQSGNFLDLFRTPNLRMKTVFISFNWLVFGLCFFGIAQYLGQSKGDIFINVAFSAVVQIPGTILCVYLVKMWGRRLTLIVANIGCGVACLVIPFVPTEPAWLRITLAVIGMFWITVSYSTSYVFAGELFPTVVRNAGVGTASMVARIGSMVAPFVAGFRVIDESIPPLIFGIIPVIGALLCIKLPETLGAALPNTIEEGERFGKKSKNTNVDVDLENANKY